MCNNEAAYILSEDAVFYSHSKHINIKYHYMWECCENNSILIHYISSEENVTNILTKALSKPQLLKLCGYLGLCNS